jgi:hypothetical protein
MKVSPGCSSARNTAWFICAARVGLHVGEVRAEQLLGSLDRERLGDVDDTGSRRSSACPDTPSAYLLVMIEPCASSTARELTMFSEAISSISCCWRPSSSWMACGDFGIGFGEASLEKKFGDTARHCLETALMRTICLVCRRCAVSLMLACGHSTRALRRFQSRWRQCRRPGRKPGVSGSCGLPFGLRLGAQASGSVRFAFPDGCPI